MKRRGRFGIAECLEYIAPVVLCNTVNQFPDLPVPITFSKPKDVYEDDGHHRPQEGADSQVPGLERDVSYIIS